MKKIGILGGGQLGMMLYQASLPYGQNNLFFMDLPTAPIHKSCVNTIIGDITNYNDVIKFGSDKLILSIEIENVNVEALSTLETKGIEIVPKPSVLRIIQNKSLQKVFYKENDISTCDFQSITNRSELIDKLKNGELSYPFVQKKSVGGYDGNGVCIILNQDSLHKAFDTHSIIEKVVDIKKELAICIARNKLGAMKSYPVVEMSFNDNANLVEYVKAPADIPIKLRADAENLARRLVEKLDYHGIMSIELFLTQDNKLLINEIAPRAHNSGHYTMNACYSSQFDQHYRILNHYSLGNSSLHTPNAIMFNILGELDNHGDVEYIGLEDILKSPLAHLHLYNKEKTRPYRKMGHVNLVGPEMDLLEDQAKVLKSKIKAISYEA